MSVRIGALMQNAFVVPNIAAAVAYWTGTVGVGPFFRFPQLVFTEGSLHGKPQIPTFKAAIAYAGELQIELIEPEGPSIFREYLSAGGTGVHHNCMTTTDFEASVASLITRGGEVVQTQTVADGSRMAYVQMSGLVPLIIEVAQLTPAADKMFAAIRHAAAVWNGEAAYFTF